MSETKFTPGPWRIGDHGDDIISTSEKIIEGDIIAEAPSSWEKSMENWPANAKIIAAAPDMFEIIKELYDWAQDTQTFGPIYPKLEAAYLKVTQ